jgi:hypothetical protein
MIVKITRVTKRERARKEQHHTQQAGKSTEKRNEQKK